MPARWGAFPIGVDGTIASEIFGEIRDCRPALSLGEPSQRRHGLAFLIQIGVGSPEPLIDDHRIEIPIELGDDLFNVRDQRIQSRNAYSLLTDSAGKAGNPPCPV